MVTGIGVAVISFEWVLEGHRPVGTVMVSKLSGSMKYIPGVLPDSGPSGRIERSSEQC